jgi:hypothetical protein
MSPATSRVRSRLRSVSSSRLYGHLVINYDANMSGFCQFHGPRSYGFRFHGTRQGHFIFRYIRSNAQVSPPHLFIARQYGLNGFFEFGICGAWTARPVGKDAA